jgi:hypothetical protein
LISLKGQVQLQCILPSDGELAAPDYLRILEPFAAEFSDEIVSQFISALIPDLNQGLIG